MAGIQLLANCCGAAADTSVRRRLGRDLVARIAVVALAVAVGIQAWLVYATAQSLHKPAGPVQAAALSQFRLNVRVEAWLTAAPLLITLGLAAWLWLGSR